MNKQIAIITGDENSEISKLIAEKELGSGTKKLKPQFTGKLQILHAPTNKHRTNGHYRDYSLHEKALLDKLKAQQKRLKKMAAKEKEDAEKP